MKICVLLLLAVVAPLASGLAEEVTVGSSNNGACNAPASTCSVFLDSPRTAKETILVIASWAGRTLSAHVTDGFNRFAPVIAPVNAPGGILRGQIWYAQNRGFSGKVEIALSGPSVPGAFDGIFVQVVMIKGLTKADQLDPSTVRSLTGTGTTLTTASDDVAVANGMVWAVFLTDAPGTPWRPSSGWTEISGGEAVSESEYKKISQGKPETARVTASRKVNWIGFAFAFRIAEPTSN